jgi:2-polyprenyl-6-methoxyphenol hydroxylase-like FAD-dependent oxidoreductase
MAASLTAMPATDFLRMLNLALSAPPHEFIQAKANGRVFPNLEQRTQAPASDDAEHLYDQQRDTFFLDMSSLVRRVGNALQGVAAKATLKAEAFEAPPEITSVEGPRLAFPLRFQKANVYSKARIALIGDAAHTVHPLAGQNLNLGIGDADALAATIAEAAARGADVGAASVLSSYSHTQQAHNLAMMAAFDGIKRLFADSVYGIPFEPLIQARNIGMLALNGLPAVKAQLIKTAMGTR